jgi:hypothetical protein
MLINYLMKDTTFTMNNNKTTIIYGIFFYNYLVLNIKYF